MFECRQVLKSGITGERGRLLLGEGTSQERETTTLIFLPDFEGGFKVIPEWGA